MTKKEFAEVKRRRKVLEAGLEVSKLFAETRKRFRLTHWEAVEVLQEQAQVYLNAAMRREHGKR